MNTRLPSTSIDAEHTLGQLAVELPGATAIFRRLKLDFCCGGNTSLRQAASDLGLDLPSVVAELGTLQRSSTPPEAAQAQELIAHIVSRYHDVHRAQLPELARMARRVEAVHRGRPGVPAGLADALEAMEQELLLHMRKEETILFPMLSAGTNGSVTQPITVMRHEHTDHGAALDHLARLTDDMTPPVHACNTWRALYSGLAQLRDDLIEHIHLENNVLFPPFEAPAEQGCGTSGCGCGQ